MAKLKFLSENWGLKLLSLVLAIVLYHAIKQTSANTANHMTHDSTTFQRN